MLILINLIEVKYFIRIADSCYLLVKDSLVLFHLYKILLKSRLNTF